METITIENVGPIVSLKVPVPDDGGIVVLRGLNDIGKTESLKALGALARPGTPLTVRDGALRGEVNGFGVKLTVGRSTRRTGELEVTAIESKYDVSELIDPGLKSADAADAKRIKALCALVGAEPNIALFRGLLSDGTVFDREVSTEAAKSDDVVLMAERVKRDLEKSARKAEDQAAKHEGEATAHMGATEGVDFTAPSDATDLNMAVERAVRRQAELEGRQQSHTEAIGRRDKAASDMGVAAAAYAGPTVSQAGDRLAQASIADQKACERLEQAEAALVIARAERSERRAALTAADGALAEAKRHTELMAQWKATLEASVPPEVTIDEQELAARDLAEARAAAERGVLVRQALGRKAQAAAAVEAASAEHIKAKGLREAAKGTDEVLSGLVSKLGTPLRVEAGRLVMDTNRGATYFAELSNGKRATIAVDIGLEAIGTDAGKRAILTLDQIIYESLDMLNRQHLAEHARKRGVLIFTAECSLEEQVTATVFGESQ